MVVGHFEDNVVATSEIGLRLFIIEKSKVQKETRGRVENWKDCSSASCDVKLTKSFNETQSECWDFFDP